MNQLFPLTDWSLESMKQALTVIIRRIDKLFSKMHKTKNVSTEWNAVTNIFFAILFALMLLQDK